MQSISEQKNIFIEGTQGSGKTTLLETLAGKLDGYRAFREGDYSPVELAWCSYMTEEQYTEMLEKFPEYVEKIRENTKVEDNFLIVTYTRIRTEDRSFYEYMERYEIYNGRKTPEEFRGIIMKRFSAFRGSGNLFECSFFQNVIETLMLYYLFSDREILAFYRDLFGRTEQEKFLMLYLYSDTLEEDIERARKERTDENGAEIWYALMLEYLNTSPYGEFQAFRSTADIAGHFRRRQKLELMVIQELFAEKCMILPAKQYNPDALVKTICGR